MSREVDRNFSDASSLTWELREGDAFEHMAHLPDASVDVLITDPPYSEHVHAHLKTNSDGHEHLIDCTFASFDDAAIRESCAQFARLARRWVIVFSAVEQCHQWREGLLSSGLQYIRTMYYRRLRVTPQISGDRPAAACEVMTLAHRPGRKRWNGGGKAGWYECDPENRKVTGHPTAKPLGLMLDLLADFTEPGELVLDPFAGTSTTGVAALRLGRRFLGFEKMPAYAALSRERLEAEARGMSVVDARAGQLSIFDERKHE